MILFQKIINQKLNNINEAELLQLAKQNSLSLNQKQASQIVSLIQGRNINVFNEQERKDLLKKIAIITSPETAKEVNQLLQQFVG
ncbi:DUF2624 domain-containing protein [Metabacillus sp. RGM 3146]|uniref:DUF2624 domain-containing protein n=1 Tax=Metabacillus sp. RGM 3146 TaxID=3401092 RepID=UPI003B992C4D